MPARIRSSPSTASALEALVRHCEPPAAERDLLLGRVALVRSRARERTAYVAFIGEFSAGKTYLVNRLLEDPGLLATSALATTAVATEIRNRARLRLSLHVDGRWIKGTSVASLATQGLFERFPSLPRDAGSLRRLVHAVTGDRDAVESLGRLQIDHPCRRLSPDVVLVDTPGLNSLDWADADRTIEVLRSRADVVIVVLAAGSGVPLSLTDFLRLQLDAEQRANACFVVTKLHEVDPAEHAGLLRSMSRRLARGLGLADVELVAIEEGQAGQAGLDRLFQLAMPTAVTQRESTVDRLVADTTEQIISVASARLRALRAIAEPPVSPPPIDPTFDRAVRNIDEAAAHAQMKLARLIETAADRHAQEARTGVHTAITGATTRATARALPPVLSAEITERRQAFRESARAGANRALKEFVSVCADQRARLADTYAGIGGAGPSRMPAPPNLASLLSTKGSSIDIGGGAHEESEAGGLAAVGAIIGTFITPGLGTVIGGAVGGLVGLFSGQRLGDISKAIEAEADRAIDQTFAAERTRTSSTLTAFTERVRREQVRALGAEAGVIRTELKRLGRDQHNAERSAQALGALIERARAAALPIDELVSVP